MAGDITFSGLASGIDTSSIIQQLVQVERQPIRMLEAKKTDLQHQRTKLQDLASAIQRLQTAAEGLSTYDELSLFRGVSSDEDVVQIAVDGDAPEGAFKIDVLSLAQVDRNYSAAFGAGAIGLVDGDTLDLTIDGVLTTVEFEAGDTLEDVASRINGSGANAWATVVGDGAGGGRLLIASEETGASQHITFGGTAAPLLVMSNVQLASDASVEIDDTVTVTSSTNLIEGVIAGATLTLTGTGTANVTIEADTAALKERIETFVEAYNDIMSAVSSEFEWTGEARTEANLSGDITLRNIQQSLQRAVVAEVEGLPGRYTCLSALGITTNREDGTLTIDATELDAALAADPGAVKDLFARNPDTLTEGIAYQLVTPPGVDELSLIESIIDSDVGSLSVRLDGIDQRTERIDEDIERMETRLAAFEERLRLKFMAMEQMISSLQSQSGYLSSLGK
jgi:flagellar hook-associated protein 2